MGFVSELARNISVLVILISLLQMLLPGAKMSGFIRMIMGLFLLSAITGPLAAILGSQDIFPVYAAENISAVKENIIAAGREQEINLTKKAAEEYKNGLEKQLSALLKIMPQLKDGKAQVFLNADSAVEKIYIEGILNTAVNGDDLELRLRDIIEGFFLLESDEIKIEFALGE
jgi:stage III sporulation protein AF